MASPNRVSPLISGRAKGVLDIRTRRWEFIGVGTTVVAPPSEPDWRISRIRLSSWWLAFKKIGKPGHALALRSTGLPR
jgi:hypothetical protein